MADKELVECVDPNAQVGTIQFLRNEGTSLYVKLHTKHWCVLHGPNSENPHNFYDTLAALLISAASDGRIVTLRVKEGGQLGSQTINKVKVEYPK